jgi:hypothetical protein
MGPMGQGPMRGRGMGWCGGAGAPLDMPLGWSASGVGRGGGWRHRRRYRATVLPGWQRAWMEWPGLGASLPGAFPWALSKERQLLLLRQQAADLEHALDELNTRIQELGRPKANTVSSGAEEEEG